MDISTGYDAFISYRRSDGSATASWIRRELQQFRPPRALRHKLARPLRIYLDTAYERGTLDFYDNTIRPALLASRHLILIATPDAVARRSGVEDWIRREVDDFSAGPNRGNVIVVRGAGEFAGPLPADIGQRYPNVQIIDLRGAGRFWFLNPLRAPHLLNEKLKLVAPLLGVLPDEMPLLRQEEERKQQVKLGAAVGAGTAIVLAASAVSLYAIRSSWQAERALDSSMFAAGQLVSRAARLDREGELKELRRSLMLESCALISRLGYEAQRVAAGANQLRCAVEQGLEMYAHDDPRLPREAIAAALAAATAQYARTKDAVLADAILGARHDHIRVLVQRGEGAMLAAEAHTHLADAARFANDFPMESSYLIAAADVHETLADAHAAAGAHEQAVQARIAAARALGAAMARETPTHDPDELIRLEGRRARLLFSACIATDDKLGRPEPALDLCRQAVATHRFIFKALASRSLSSTHSPSTTLEAAVAAAMLADLAKRRQQVAEMRAALADADAWTQAIKLANNASEDVKEKAAGLADALREMMR